MPRNAPPDPFLNIIKERCRIRFAEQPTAVLLRKYLTMGDEDWGMISLVERRAIIAGILEERGETAPAEDSDVREVIEEYTARNPWTDTRSEGERQSTRRWLRAASVFGAGLIIIAVLCPEARGWALAVGYLGIVNPALAVLIARNHVRSLDPEFDARMAGQSGVFYWLHRGIPNESSRGTLAFARGGVNGGWALGVLLIGFGVVRLFGFWH